LLYTYKRRALSREATSARKKRRSYNRLPIIGHRIDPESSPTGLRYNESHEGGYRIRAPRKIALAANRGPPCSEHLQAILWRPTGGGYFSRCPIVFSPVLARDWLKSLGNAFGLMAVAETQSFVMCRAPRKCPTFPSWGPFQVGCSCSKIAPLPVFSPTALTLE